jgi:hypothetical protein
LALFFKFINNKVTVTQIDIYPGDKVFVVSASMENETSVISTLCIPCASTLLTEAVINKKLIISICTPELLKDKEEYTLPEDQSAVGDINQTGTIKLINLDSNHNGHIAALSFQVLDDGFRLSLQCADGVSYSVSELFTWNRIAQLLIAANPDMFGALSEPLHHVFPESLITLGYNIPDWPE